MDKLREAAHLVVESEIALIAVRVLQLVGIPASLALLAWFGSEVMDLGRRMAVIEASRIQGRVEIIQRIERLEGADQRDRETLASLGRQIATVDATAAAILRQLEGIERAMILREQRNRQ